MLGFYKSYSIMLAGDLRRMCAEMETWDPILKIRLTWGNLTHTNNPIVIRRSNHESMDYLRESWKFADGTLFYWKMPIQWNQNILQAGVASVDILNGKKYWYVLFQWGWNASFWRPHKYITLYKNGSDKVKMNFEMKYLDLIGTKCFN